MTSMKATTETERLKFEHLLPQILRPFKPSEMLVVSERGPIDGMSTLARFCGLVPTVAVSECLNDWSWDLRVGDGSPTAISTFSEGSHETFYSRFGTENGMEPLVIDRSFHGAREGYVEINEEFRLFHNLWEDKRRGVFYRLSDDGSEEIAATIVGSKVEIRWRELREFLAVKDMHLALYFDAFEYSTSSLAELGLNSPYSDDIKEALSSFHLHVGTWDPFAGDNRKTIARLLGKRFLEPMDRSRVPFLGYREQPDFPEFVLSVDEDDNPIKFSCNPDLLANNFGANPNAPHYLAPVQFTKDVLEKYRHEPTKYQVSDSLLACHGLWSVRIDNHHDDRVMVFLGDLGRDLPASEWPHWLGKNKPRTHGLSEVYFRRSILGEFADSDHPEHRFKQEYRCLCETSFNKLGWEIYLPLDSNDRHYLDSIRVPANDEQKVFDDLILALTKVLVDSLNENQLKRNLPAGQEGTTGSISRLASILRTLDVDQAVVEGNVQMLRDLQKLRSTGSAHRKGTEYRKLAKTLGLESGDLSDYFRALLVRAADFLTFLGKTIESGKFPSQNCQQAL